MHAQISIPTRRLDIDRATWRDADFKFTKFYWTLIALGGFAQLRQRSGRFIQIQLPSIPAIARLNGTAIGRSRMSSNENRWVGLLDGQRMLNHTIERGELSRECRR